jgi:hypothetical protein
MSLGLPDFQDIDGMNDADWPVKTGGPISFVPDLFGNDAPDFDGLTQDMRRAALSISGLAEFTYTTMFKLDSTGAAQCIASMQTGGGVRQFAIYLTSAGKIEVTANDQGSASVGSKSTSTATYDTGTLHHLGVKMSATTGLTIYVDGPPVALDNDTINLGGGGPFTKFGGTLSDHVIGTIEEFPSSRALGTIARPKAWYKTESDADMLEEALFELAGPVAGSSFAKLQLLLDD